MAGVVVVRRTPRAWIMRTLLALAVLVVGFVAIRQTMGAATRSGDPAQAWRLAPEDGRNATALAEQVFVSADTGSERARARQLAQAALRMDPTAVGAASIYGLDAQARGDLATARAAFTYAQRLSRRDLQTQLWAIEDAVGRGDVPGVLRHYDIALRTSRQATDLLFPVLSGAIADPAIRMALVRTFGGRPAWQGDFISFVSTNGTNPIATAALFMALRAQDYRISDEATAAVTTALVQRGSIDAAWRYYASVRPGVDRRRSRDPNFHMALAEPTPFDWNLVSEDGPSAALQAGDAGGILDFTSPSGVGGTVLRQQQLLPPGSYRLAGRSSGIEAAETMLPYWVLQCGDGRELGRVTIQTQGDFTGIFVVPAGCPMQRLSLVVRPSDAVTGISGQISRAELRSAQVTR